MDHTIVRIYHNAEDAEAARAALLEAGFARDAIELTSTVDEAGPVRGNFATGNGDRDTPDNPAGFTDGNEKGSYNRNFSTVSWGGTHVLTVDAGEQGRAQAAAAIMDRHRPVADARGAQAAPGADGSLRR